MKLTPWFCIAVLIIVLNSCSSPRYIYSVTPQNLPSLQKKGDFQVDAFYSTNVPELESEDSNNKDHYSNGIDGNMAWALNDHWAITGTLGYRWEKTGYSNYYSTDTATNKFINSTSRYYRMNWELGGGYFTSISKTDKFFLQIFGGVGAGRYSLDDNGITIDQNNPSGPNINYTRYHDVNVFRFYIHPAIHFYFSEHFNMAIGARLTNVHYSNIRTDFSNAELIGFRLAGLNGNIITLFEPCIDLKFRIPGAEWVAPHIQTGFSSYLENYNTEKFNFSIGITLMHPIKK